MVAPELPLSLKGKFPTTLPHPALEKIGRYSDRVVERGNTQPYEVSLPRGAADLVYSGRHELLADPTPASYNPHQRGTGAGRTGDGPPNHCG